SFSDATGRPIQFRDAVNRQSDGMWQLRPHAKPVFKSADRDPRCLGGTPGRWHEFYRGRSPAQFGYDPDLAVMYWDHQTRRGRAASVNVLRGILGDKWKERLREIHADKLSGRGP